MIELRVQIREPERATKAASDDAAWRFLLALAAAIVKAHARRRDNGNGQKRPG